MPDSVPGHVAKRPWGDVLKTFARPRLLAMLGLGFCAGLPFYLVYGVLSAWLREAGVSRATIGFFVWIGLFYTLKFIWAPIVDRIRLPGLYALFGQRRSWIVLAQVGLVTGLIGVGFSNPESSLMALALFILLVAFSSATQDIAVDAWRIEAAEDDEQAAFAAMYQGGYRAGLILATTGAFAVAGLLSPDLPDGQGEVYTPLAWSAAYWAMAGLIIVGASTVLWAGEPLRMRDGESRWPRSADWPRNLAVGLSFIAAAISGAIVLLQLLALALGPIGVGFTWIWNLLGDTPLPVIVLLAAGLVALPFYLRSQPRWLMIIVALAALVATYFALGRLGLSLIHGFGSQVSAVNVGTGTLPVYFALTPFVLATALVPIATRLGDSSPWLTHPIAGAPLDFFRRFAWTALFIFAFIALYRISDFTMGVMANPLYIDIGYTKEEISAIKGIFGWVTGLSGAFLGGVVGLRLGLKPTLVIGALITVATNLAFAWLAAHDSSGLWRLFIAVGADNVAGGFAGGALIAYMSTLTSTAFTASQYAIFSSLYAIYGKLLAGFSGVLADAVGWVWFFTITAGFGVPAVLLSLALFGIATYERGHASSKVAASS